MERKQNFQWGKLELGTCYYPEHWDKSLWESDLDRMLAHGITTIRIAEFAWSLVEPQEGQFTFAFWDEFLDLAEAKGMKVIFGTPTATPPAWLTDKYPEVLNARRDGVLYRHGMRRHYNYNSKKYQELAARVVEQLGQHYGKRPCIVGWQIDNEFNCETQQFYSESDTVAFRRFLQEKYGTLEALNQAWGAVFWDQTYTSWEQVYVPRTTYGDGVNPQPAAGLHPLCVPKRHPLLPDAVRHPAQVQQARGFHHHQRHVRQPGQPPPGGGLPGCLHLRQLPQLRLCHGRRPPAQHHPKRQEVGQEPDGSALGVPPTSALWSSRPARGAAPPGRPRRPSPAR